MPKYDSIDHWKASAVAQLETIERGLYVIQDRIFFYGDPVEVFVLGGNEAVKDSVDVVFAHHLGRIAYELGYLSEPAERAFTQGEITLQVGVLSEQGRIQTDPRNLAKYYHPDFVRI